MGAAADIQLRAHPALSGLALQGRAASLELTVLSSKAAAVNLVLTDARGETKVALNLAEYSEQTLPLDVWPSADGRVVLSLSGDDGQLLQQSVDYDLAARPLLLVINSVPYHQQLLSHTPASEFRPLLVSPSGLPRTASGYAPVEAVIVDQASLKNLGKSQYQALGEYLSRCGILFIVASDSNRFDALRGTAGCRGRFIATVSDLRNLPDQLRALYAQRPLPPPGLQELDKLNTASLSAQRLQTLCLYLGGYLLFMLIAVWRLQSVRLLWLSPLLASALGLVVWMGESTPRLLHWAEMESGSGYARLSSLLTLGGQRLGSSRYHLSAGLHLGPPGAQTHPAHIEYRPADGRYRLQYRGALFDAAKFHMYGQQARLPDIQLKTGRDGIPRVTGHDEVSLKNARMLWRGQVYSLVNNSNNAGWSPRFESVRAAQAPAERLLANRLSGDEPAVLMPMRRFPANSDPAAEQRGWLVIRAASAS